MAFSIVKVKGYYYSHMNNNHKESSVMRYIIIFFLALFSFSINSFAGTPEQAFERFNQSKTFDEIINNTTGVIKETYLSYKPQMVERIVESIRFGDYRIRKFNLKRDDVSLIVVSNSGSSKNVTNSSPVGIFLERDSSGEWKVANSFSPSEIVPVLWSPDFLDFSFYNQKSVFSYKSHVVEMQNAFASIDKNNVLKIEFKPVPFDESYKRRARYSSFNLTPSELETDDDRTQPHAYATINLDENGNVKSWDMTLAKFPGLEYSQSYAENNGGAIQYLQFNKRWLELKFKVEGVDRDGVERSWKIDMRLPVYKRGVV